MSLIKEFTRREVLALTETTSNRLQYLERAGLIVPRREGAISKPTVLYSWEQLLEIRSIKNLRQEVSLQTVRKIIEFLDKSGFDDSLRDKQIVVVEEDVFWVRTDWKDFCDHIPSALQVAGKNNKGVGQYMLIVLPPLIDIVDEIWEAARSSTVVDFESFAARAKVKSRRQSA